MKTVGIFNDTSISGHYGCTAVMKTLTSELQQRGVKPAYLWPVAEDWKPHRALLEQYRPDIIVVNGEGTLHHSRDRKRTRDHILGTPGARSGAIAIKGAIACAITCGTGTSWQICSTMRCWISSSGSSLTPSTTSDGPDASISCDTGTEHTICSTARCSNHTNFLRS